MRTRKAKAGELIHRIKVSLNGWPVRKMGQLYRILAIGDQATLYELASIINDAYNFGFDHMFGFYDNIKNWTNAEEGYELFADTGEESRYKSVEKTLVREMFQIRDKWLFLFDYGDEWQFVVKRIAVEPPNKTGKYPQIVESIGEAPPQYPDFDEDDDWDEDDEDEEGGQ